MPNVTVSSKTEQAAKQYQKSEDLKSVGEAVDALVDYALRRQKALKKYANKPKTKKKLAAKAKATKAPKKVKAPKAPKTGLAGKLSKGKKAKAPALKGNRKPRPTSQPAPQEAKPESAPVDSGDDEDDEPDPLAHTPEAEESHVVATGENPVEE